MGCCCSTIPVPDRPIVPPGRIRICVAGVQVSHNVGKAVHIAEQIARSYPDVYETWFYFGSCGCCGGTGYFDVLPQFIEPMPETELSKESTLDKGTTVQNHRSAPFIWLEEGGTVGENGECLQFSGKKLTAIGGADKFRLWALDTFPEDEAVQAVAGIPPNICVNLCFDDSVPQGTYLLEAPCGPDGKVSAT